MLSCDKVPVRQVPILPHGCGRCARDVPCGVRGVGCARLRRAGESESGGYMPFLAEAALPDKRGDTYLKQHDAPEDVEYYLCGPPMMAKTVLDLLHSLGVDDADIRFDNFGG